MRAFDEQALMAAIAANPDDDAPRIIYADWLQQAGDPRGELIAVQCALAHKRTTQLATRELDLLERHEVEWLEGAGLRAGEARFVRGFIERVEASAVRVASVIESLRAQPCLRFLRVEVDWGGNESDLRMIADRLSDGMPAALEQVLIDRQQQWDAKRSDVIRRQRERLELHIDEPSRASASISVFEAMLTQSAHLTAIEIALCGRGRVEIDELIARLSTLGSRPGVRSFEVRFANASSRNWVQWIATRRLDDLVGAFPSLEKLTLPMAEIWLDELVHARLRQLELSWLGEQPYGPGDSMVWGAGPTPRGAGLLFMRRAWLPSLERLAIDFQYDWYVDWEPDDIAALCETTGLPRLSQLELRYCLLGDEICRRLPDAPFAAQLEELDLTATEVSEEGARRLIERRASFSRLQRLVCIRFMEVSDATWAALAAAYPIQWGL